MDRRRFLRTGIAASAVGLAGCSLGGDGGSSGDGSDPETDTATQETIPDEKDGTPAATTGDGSTEPTEAGTSSDSGLPRLQTDGSWIVTEDGERFTPRGVNVIEPLFADQNAAKRGGDYTDTLELATATQEAWYNYVLRLPVTQWGIDQLGFDEYASRFVDTTVEHCRERGVYVILDYHIIEDWQDAAVHRQVETFWDFFASRYADEPHVLYEFWNEPQNPADDTLANWEAWKEVAQPMVDRIRKDAPDTPIIVGSPGWTSLTRYAAESPFEGENLIYAGHIYPGDGKSADALDPDYGAPADEVPVMITEWGFDGTDTVQPGTKSNFGEPFREWLDGRENVGWTAWCLDSHWHPTMLDFDHNTTGGETYHGWFVKRWLAETRERQVPDSLVLDGNEFRGPQDSTPPETPTGVTVEGADSRSVSLSWDQSKDFETRVMHYNVYVNGELRETIDPIGLLNEASAEDAWSRFDLRFQRVLQGFAPGSTYDVTVSAVDSLSNESLESQVVTYEPAGELEIHAEIPQASSPPSIDGSVDDAWSEVTERPFQHAVQGSVDGESDLGGGWRATWDSDALYLLAEVSDDSRSVDSEAFWQDDSVEVYVDGDNSKRAAYDGENDFQIVFRRGDSNVSGTVPNDIGDDFAWAETDEGYRLEAALPWSALAPNQTIEAGQVIGFDCHVNDDDDGGERDGKLNWFNEQDDSWENPGAFANVELVE